MPAILGRVKLVSPAGAATLLFALTGCVPNLSSFTVEDERPVDAGADAGVDGSLPLDAGGDTDGGGDAGMDAGEEFTPTGVDTECGTPWTDLADAPSPECAGREVTTVATPIDSLSVALGRANDGTITVAHGELDGPDFGRVRTVVFGQDAADSPSDGPSIEPLASIGDVVGTDLRIATEPPDIHHIALWYRSDFGNEAQLRTLRGGVLGPTVTIASGVGRSGVVDVAIDSDGRTVVGWHDDDSGENAARRETESGTFGEPVVLRRDGDPRLVGSGAMSLVAGGGRTVHAAYQWSVTLAASAPSYSVGTGTSWSTARTLDNTAIANRASGVGADLTLAGEDPVVAYLDWIDGFGEVRLARIGSGPVAVTTHMMGVVIGDRPGDHPIEIATDVEGFLHLLVADAGSEGVRLEYHRQTLVAGELRWIADTIAELPAAVPAEVQVDMKLGPDRRPHIVYWDPTLGHVRYATVRP